MTFGMVARGVRRWMRVSARMGALLCLVTIFAGCAQAPSATTAASTPATTCIPTDQDQYVYDPGRLQVIQSCIRVTGTVDNKFISTDGDSIILVRLDPPYQHLLTPGNFDGEDGGDLGVEAVCTVPSLEAAVIGLCAGNPDPVVGPYPAIGTHVWVEGRYIYDLHHEAHAELHPLYRIGAVAA